MKKTLRSILVIALSMVMAMSMLTTAFAAVYDPNVGGGTIREEAPTPSEPTSYKIQINEDQKDSIQSDKKTATAGQLVTLTLDKGVNADAIAVLDENGNLIPLTKVSDTEYTFRMPAGDVTIGEDLRLITDDHFAYIKGYPDGSFKPQGNLTRAEAATIFYRLLVNTNVMKSVTFSDVKAGSWYYEAVSVLAGKGVIKGYPDGTFGPNRTVTRAEFCTMASRFFRLKEGTVKFTDVKTSFWGYRYIASAVAYGWLTDAEVAYNPNGAISRAEVVNLVNRMLGRVADAEFVEKNAKSVTSFTDVKTTDSFFLDVMEAANAHDFKTTRGVENWTGLK